MKSKKQLRKMLNKSFCITITHAVPIKFHEAIGHPDSLKQEFHFDTKERAREFQERIAQAKRDNNTIIKALETQEDSVFINVDHIVNVSKVTEKKS